MQFIFCLCFFFPLFVSLFLLFVILPFVIVLLIIVILWLLPPSKELMEGATIR